MLNGYSLSENFDSSALVKRSLEGLKEVGLGV